MTLHIKTDDRFNSQSIPLLYGATKSLPPEPIRFMTLREYYAGLAMQELIGLDSVSYASIPCENPVDNLASKSVMFADQLICNLKKDELSDRQIEGAAAGTSRSARNHNEKKSK